MPPIRVLIVDDSPTARALIAAVLRSAPGLEIAGEARDGNEAVVRAKALRPDVITMDFQMPEVDGFSATRRIMLEAPTPIVIVSGSLDVRDVVISMEAMRAGALAIVAKPPSPAAPEFERASRQFAATVRAMSQVKIVRRFSTSSPPAPTPLPPRPALVATEKKKIIGIAASTGGPAALHRILSDLGGPPRVPVLVVQHIAIGFAEGLASWLATAVKMPVKLAYDHEPLLPGTVYLSPDQRHLAVGPDGCAEIVSAAPVHGFRPSANVLFESIAQRFGGSGAGVILTGMGEDGVEGLRKLGEAGGFVIAQDEESSAVFGMPRAAIDAGVVNAVLPLDMVAARLRELTA